MTIKTYTARLQSYKSGEQIEKSRLSCPVRPDDRPDLPRWHRETNIARCVDSAKMPAEFHCAKDVLTQSEFSALRLARKCW